MVVDTNGGPMITNTKCNFKSIGEVWFCKKAITNILLLSDMADKFRVTLDTNVEKALVVYFSTRKVKFK